MIRIRLIIKQLSKGVRRLDPVVGHSDAGNIVYGRFECMQNWLDEGDGDFWCWNALEEAGKCCYDIKKITEDQLARYMGL